VTARRLGRSGHVADRLIGDGREPSADEARHLATCPGCFAGVRRGRAFDRRLGDAVAVLPTPAIPPEVLTMPMPPIRRLPAPSLTSLGVIAALVVAAGLVAWTVLPGGGTGASARPTLAPDPHLVVVDGATWRISLVGRSIEIHRSTSGSVTGEELLASWDLGEFVNGGTSSNLRCPRPDGGVQWAVFGHQADYGADFTYRGPPARGQMAPDGLWLWMIDMSTFDPTTPIRLVSPNGELAVGLGPLRARPTDVRQPSGCFFSR